MTAHVDRTAPLPDVATTVQRVRTRAAVVTLRPGPAGPGSPELRDEPGHVWYVSYGSNLLRDRFDRYLLGGRLPGLDVEYPGGPATAPATADRPVVLPGSLRLAGEAPAWGGGGVCFWDRTPGGSGVLARAWRVTLAQFREVVHLENGGELRRQAPWSDAVLRDGEGSVGEAWYGRLVRCGRLDDEPALTFTAPRGALPPSCSPSPRYRTVVADGLLETFGPAPHGSLTRAEADAYLAAAGA